MKNIKNLDELVSYYNNKADWTPAEVKEFVKIKNDFYDKDWEKFDDEIAGFDDDGYGKWSLETRNCDGWNGLDDLIGKFCGEKDLDIIANEDEYNFLYPIDDEVVCFSLENFRDYLGENNCKLVGGYCDGFKIKFGNDYIKSLENKINKKLENEKFIVKSLKDDENLEEVEEVIMDIIDEEKLDISKNFEISRPNFKDKKQISIYHKDIEEVDNDIVEREYYISIY